jgi:hypothetical protein
MSLTVGCVSEGMRKECQMLTLGLTGADYALNSTQLAYNLIYEQDGYHPVSLVLNCENYFFIEYALNGADLVMVDPYPIAMNARWSKPYNTYVDENFGDSGCDNCNGTFYDISTRIESTRNRARLQGAWRTKVCAPVLGMTASSLRSFTAGVDSAAELQRWAARGGSYRLAFAISS